MREEERVSPPSRAAVVRVPDLLRALLLQARSMQAPKKKTGKSVMFRSAPPQRRARRKEAEAKGQDEDLDAEFFKW